MLKVGDRVKVKAKTGGPDLSPALAPRRLEFWGLTGVIISIVPELDWPIVVEFTARGVPAMVRFWGHDLQKV